MVEINQKIVLAALITLLLTLQYALWSGDFSLVNLWKLEEQVEAQERINQQLELRNRRIQAEVIDLKKGQDALEERARAQLGMIREGEVFLQVLEPEEEGGG